jgi:caffeoyl-CoA O-methyltransferase
LELILPLAEAYAANYSKPEDELLQALTATAIKEHQQPHMISGHLQGQFLEIISKIAKPNRILEIGTMVGYSAICLAKGLVQNGVLHTIELREEDASTAKQNILAAGLHQQVVVHTGNAASIIPLLNETWDLVFIDADKTGYSEYYDLVKPRLSRGGIILADNVLFHGEVLKTELSGKNAKAIHAFNEKVKADDEVENVLLTMRDGLMIIRKK